MISVLKMDLDHVWTTAGVMPIADAMPLAVETPERQWGYGLSVPILTEQSSPIVRARIVLGIGSVDGKVRVGILSPDRNTFVAEAILDHNHVGNSELLLTVSGETGPLVIQNLRADGLSKVLLMNITVIPGPAYPEERRAALQRYMEAGFNSVEGWCHYLNVEFLQAMDTVLFAHEVDGGIAEIGVHHGKQFVALHNLMADDAKSLAIDVFGRQWLNLDRSGAGDRDIFQSNLEAWGSNPDSCIVHECDSLSLKFQDLDRIFPGVGLVKFFGVDGCHEVEHTASDLRTASAMLAQGGVIILDDYLNPDFPGVHQAIAYMFINDRPGIAPFLIGQNKLYLTHVSHHSRYLSATRVILRNIRETASVREINLYGYSALSWRSNESSWAYPERDP